MIQSFYRIGYPSPPSQNLDTEKVFLSLLDIMESEHIISESGKQSSHYHLHNTKLFPHQER